MKIQNVSPGTYSIDRGNNIPQFEESHILPGSDLAPARIVLSTAQIDQQIVDRRTALQLKDATSQEKLYIVRRAEDLEKANRHSMVWYCRI